MAAIAALDPPLEPPGVFARFHGLRVGPYRRLVVFAVEPNSGVFVLPTTIAVSAVIFQTHPWKSKCLGSLVYVPPAARRRSTTTES